MADNLGNNIYRSYAPNLKKYNTKVKTNFYYKILLQQETITKYPRC